MLLSILVGYEPRLWLIWCTLFPGICLVSFNDACTFQALTTKRTLELALVLFAVPFLVSLMLGLRKNLEGGGWQVLARCRIDVNPAGFEHQSDWNSH